MKKVLLFILIFLPLCFFGCAKQNQIKLGTPQNLSVENGIITFERVKDEGYYLIEINDLAISATTNNSRVELYTENEVNYFAYNAQDLFVVGSSYSVKVQAQAKGKKASDVAEVSYLHRDRLQAPSNLVVSGSVLSWDAVENADSYSVETSLPNGQTQTDTTNKNSLDLGGILTFGGAYSFKVYAQTSNQNFVKSDAATKAYEHFVALATPSNLSVTDDAQFELSVSVDGFANAIVLRVNNETQIVEKQSANVSVVGDVWKIKLSNNSPLGNYTISAQATFITSAKNYYIPSAFSQNLNYVRTQTLAAPQVVLDKANGQTMARWSTSEIAHVAGFKVEINMGTSVDALVFESDVTTFVLPEGWVSVSVSALGKDFYLNSAATTVNNS